MAKKRKYNLTHHFENVQDFYDLNSYWSYIGQWLAGLHTQIKEMLVHVTMALI